MIEFTGKIRLDLAKLGHFVCILYDNKTHIVI